MVTTLRYVLFASFAAAMLLAVHPSDALAGRRWCNRGVWYNYRQSYYSPAYQNGYYGNAYSTSAAPVVAAAPATGYRSYSYDPGTAPAVVRTPAQAPLGAYGSPKFSPLAR